jgi:hypothetical protein
MVRLVLDKVYSCLRSWPRLRLCLFSILLDPLPVHSGENTQMAILPFVTWLDGSALAQGIRDSRWLFPVIEACHLLGLAVLGGCVLIVNMRLLGLGLRGQSAGEVSRDVRPFMLASLAVMLVSGFLLFASEAIKCSDNKAFWVKMSCLVLAVIATFTIQDRAIQTSDRNSGAFQVKLAALVSVLLWTGVGVSGRWIGFS